MDRLLYMFPDEVRVLKYRDNARGGVESDCVVDLEMGCEGNRVQGRIELSRTRTLRNSFRFRCERGTIELKSGDRYSLLIHPEGASSSEAPFAIEASAPGQLREESWYGSFAAQFDEWHQAIRTGRPCELAGSVALQALQVFEECYENPELLDEPWVNAVPHAGVTQQAPTSAPPTVLITGATGFIGGRAAEVLSLQQGWKVRALVHNPAHASRLACLPVEMVVADLTDAEAMKKAVQGCDAVVHCAIGTTWGDRQRIFDVTVGGTQRLVDAARLAGVRRFVHLSTFAIHDLTKPGVIDETTAPNPPGGNDYAESKAEADRVIQAAAADSLSAVILRLANVYGPNSTIFITRPVQRLVEGSLRLVGPAAEIPSSTVFVDSVVGAIIRALHAPDADVRGQVFTISDGDRLSWADFFGYFAEAAGVPLQMISDQDYAGLRGDATPDRGVAWWLKSPFLGAAQVVRSPEMWGLVKRTLKTDPIYAVGQAAFERSPALKRQVSNWLGIDAPPIYEPPSSAGVVEAFHFELTRPYVDNTRAQTVLGFMPTPRAHGMAITRDWLKNARILP
jgi:nucleoside-diphosphate-sugar epimerase